MVSKEENHRPNEGAGSFNRDHWDPLGRIIVHRNWEVKGTENSSILSCANQYTVGDLTVSFRQHISHSPPKKSEDVKTPELEREVYGMVCSSFRLASMSSSKNLLSFTWHRLFTPLCPQAGLDAVTPCSEEDLQKAPSFHDRSSMASGTYTALSLVVFHHRYIHMHVYFIYN